MTPGDPAVKDSWGTILNAALPCIEQVAAGISTVDLTGLTAYTLLVANDAPDQARAAMLILTGSPTAACTVTMPSVARIGWVANKSTQNVILATAAASVNLTIPPGASFLYLCDGTSVSQVPIGAAGVLNAMGGVLIANGATYRANDPGGVSRPLLGIGSDGYTNLFMGGITGWRVLNQAGTAALFSIAPNGGAAFAAGLGVAGPLTVGGALTVTGDAHLTNLTVTGTTTFATTQSTPGGFVSNGFDTGGLNIRMVGGAYGAGWRNDGTNTYLLLTNSGNQTGPFNSLRPFWVTDATGAVHFDGTGAGSTFGGAVAVTGAVSATNFSAPLASLGGVTFSGSGGMSATQIVAGGNISAVGNVAGAGGIFNTLSATNAANIVNVLFSGAGNLATPGTVSAAAFNTTSDRRAKSEIADITPEDGYDWITRGRPRSYIMNGRFQAGFVAQEDLDRGRGAAVKSIPDDRPEFALSDGYAPEGSRLVRQYEHDIAYLTAALQGALARIAALEASAA